MDLFLHAATQFVGCLRHTACSKFHRGRAAMTTSSRPFRRFFKMVTGQYPRYVGKHDHSDEQLALLEKRVQVLKRSLRARQVRKRRLAFPGAVMAPNRPTDVQ
jgi:hypothetical protein